MKRCINCNQEISDNAKFCGYCQTKQEPIVMPSQSANNQVCPMCQAVNSATAKFCHTCGQKLGVVEAQVKPRTESGEDRDINKQRGYITWGIHPGQLAVKIDEKEMDSYGIVRGLYVAPGTKALFFVNGKYAATLESGRYSFGELKNDAKEDMKKEEKKGVMGFLSNVAGHIANGAMALFGMSGRPFYSVVLCRGNEFPLVYEFENVQTEYVRCNIGLHLLCRITDMNSFADSLLTDRKFVTLETVSSTLQPYIRTIVNQAFLGTNPDKINEDAAVMQNFLAVIAERTKPIYPYIAIEQIISVTADNEQLNEIRRLKEELYINEQRLEQIQLRYDFNNRLQDANRSNQLREARSEVDFQALVDEIQMDSMTNEDRKEQFVLMLMAEKELRMARTQTDLSVALDKLEQSRMLSKEEIAILQERIDHQAAIVRIGHDQEIDMAKLENGQLLAMATLKNEIELDKEKLQWEIEIGNRRFQNELWREREVNKLKNEERNADLDYEKRMMNDQLDLLSRAQALRNEREQAEHVRQIELIRANNELELSKMENDLEKTKLMSTMTFEQIMAVNPNITPEAAMALAEKFKAQAAMANTDKYESLVRQHQEDLKEMLRGQMDLTKEVLHSQNSMNETRLRDKQAELDRVHSDSERNTDRVLDSVKTTVGAVSGQPHIIASATPFVNAVQPISTVVKCERCGQENGKDNTFCEGCGTKLIP